MERCSCPCHQRDTKHDAYDRILAADCPCDEVAEGVTLAAQSHAFLVEAKGNLDSVGTLCPAHGRRDCVCSGPPDYEIVLAGDS